jgi:DNA-binding CsgD family transcriptional regulator
MASGTARPKYARSHKVSGPGVGRRQQHILTPAEWRAVYGLTRGLPPDGIAASLGVSVHTIRTQLKRAMAKAGVRTQAALVAWAFSFGRGMSPPLPPPG